MGILEEDVAKVRDLTDFVALVSEHLAVRRVGSRWVALCPFHAEKTPSFSINPELGLYYCFGCGAKGDVITFVQEIDQVDFVGAVEKLAGRVGVTLRYDTAATGDRHQRRSRLHETLAKAIEWYHQRLLEAPDAAPARRYLRAERGYDGDVVRQYQLGWAPAGWSNLRPALGVPVADLVAAGLVVADGQRSRDFFRSRLLFPIFDARGQPVGLGGRILPGGPEPKYMNTGKTALYDKSRVLYGLNWAKKHVVERGQVVVCEGYTDVIGLHRAGVEEAVATCGTALADGHVRLLTNFARRLVLAYDADGAGQAAADRFYDWEQRFGAEIRVAVLPPGADPADLARSDPEALRAAVADAQPYLRFRLSRLFGRADLDTPEGRARAAEAALDVIGEHPSPLVRDQYLMEVADRCRLTPERLRQWAAGPNRRRHVPAPSGTKTRRGGPGPGGAERRGGPAGAGAPGGAGAASVDGPEPPRYPGRLPPLPRPELEALRLAVHRPEEVGPRLERVLFSHPLACAAFDTLAASDTLAEAIAGTDPATAELLSRLAVEDITAGADDVMIRLLERAGQGALAALGQESRRSDDPLALVETVGWLKLTLEELRASSAPEPGEEPVGERSIPAAEARLVAWLRSRAEAGDE